MTMNSSGIKRRFFLLLFDYEGGHMIAQSALDAMFEWIEAAEDSSSTSRQQSAR